MLPELKCMPVVGWCPTYTNHAHTPAHPNRTQHDNKARHSARTATPTVPPETTATAMVKRDHGSPSRSRSRPTAASKMTTPWRKGRRRWVWLRLPPSLHCTAGKGGEGSHTYAPSILPSRASAFSRTRTLSTWIMYGSLGEASPCCRCSGGQRLCGCRRAEGRACPRVVVGVWGAA